MKRRTLYTIIGVIAIVAVIAGIIIWQTQKPAQPTGETRTAVVERGTLLVVVSASGVIEPRDRVNLTFEQPGSVHEVLVEIGDTVEKDVVLARLDTGQLALQVRQARAALASAEAQLAQLKKGARPEEVAAAEANLHAAEAQVSGAAAQLNRLKAGATDAEIAAAEAELASATIQQIRAEDLHELTMTCYTFELGGEERTFCPALGAPEEQARYNLEAADKALAAAQARYAEVLAGADANQIRAAEASVLAAAAQRDAAKAQLDLLLSGATEGQVAATEAQAEQARASLEQAELALEMATLRAPFDGIVAAVNIKTGEMAPTGQPAITVIDISQFHITVSVDELDVGRLSEGQAAQITIDAFPNAALDGTVASIAPAATFEGSVVYYDIVIALGPTDVPIRADMTANATIVVEKLTDVLLIPTWVVRVDRATGQTYVDKQVGEQTERVDVKLGVRHEGAAQVLDGLVEGDVVVWIQTSRFGPQ
ncbi:MAG: efflux RND transporter periplasmic adaptor subunit [Anaerolineae bacterium]|nr:efflux RND transporter periplasmic adaptor subunit [Anaerolineae bacterium]